MAERRMFTKKITDADEFVALPSSAQALYLHLNMAADDDGFNNQIQIAMYKAHASVDDIKVLLAKRFIIQFDNGVIVIKHWRMANALRKDRYNPTNYQEELKLLKIKDNGAYTFSDDGRLPDGCQMVAKCLPQDRLGKDSIDEVSLGKDRLGEDIVESKDSMSSDNDYEKIKRMWNALDGLGDIKGIKALTDKRKMAIRARLKEYSLENFEEAIENIRHSDFLQGKHNGRPFVITFDWFIRPNNFPKVLEGNYTPKRQESSGDVVDMWQKAFEESEARNNDQG